MHIYVRIIATPEIKERAREVGLKKRQVSSDGIGEQTEEVEASSLEVRNEGLPFANKDSAYGLSGTSKTSDLSASGPASTSPWDPRGIPITAVPKRSAAMSLAKSRSSRNLATSKASSTGSMGDSMDHPDEPGNPGNSSVITEPGRPTPWERLWLSQITSDKDDDAIEQFQR